MALRSAVHIFFSIQRILFYISFKYNNIEKRERERRTSLDKGDRERKERRQECEGKGERYTTLASNACSEAPNRTTETIVVSILHLILQE